MTGRDGLDVTSSKPMPFWASNALHGEVIVLMRPSVRLKIAIQVLLRYEPPVQANDVEDVTEEAPLIEEPLAKEEPFGT